MKGFERAFLDRFISMQNKPVEKNYENWCKPSYYFIIKGIFFPKTKKCVQETSSNIKQYE